MEQSEWRKHPVVVLKRLVGAHSRELLLVWGLQGYRWLLKGVWKRWDAWTGVAGARGTRLRWLSREACSGEVLCRRLLCLALGRHHLGHLGAVPRVHWDHYKPLGHVLG